LSFSVFYSRYFLQLVSLLLKRSIKVILSFFNLLFWVFYLTCFFSFEAFRLNLFCRHIILQNFCRLKHLTLPILGLAEADKGGTPGRLLLPLVSFLLSSINFFYISAPGFCLINVNA
jgi:hypothetical protein